ncbi:MAG: hypothetical protein QOE92_110, partial [Chloroflexota bacterium]|nr:hypothetical protein [Chloroflexota bacterium]
PATAAAPPAAATPEPAAPATAAAPPAAAVPIPPAEAPADNGGEGAQA